MSNSKYTEVENLTDSVKEYKNILNKMETEIKKNDMLTTILGLLEEDYSIDMVVDIISKEMESYFKSPVVGVCKYSGKDGLVEVGGYAKDEQSVKDWECFLNMCSKENIIFSEEVALVTQETQEFYNVFGQCNFGSGIIKSITINGGPSMNLVVLFHNIISISHEDKALVSDIGRMLKNIIEKRIFQNSLAGSYNALKDILDNIGIGIFVIDKANYDILFCNDNMCKIFGENPVGKKCCDFPIGNDLKNCEQCEFLMQSSYYRETYDIENSAWYIIKNNDITWVDGRQVSLCSVTDITEKKKYEKKIEFQANNDFLTGLYNRMRCETDLSETIARSVNEETHGYVMFLDLDNFKHINDGLGHQYGDMLLKMVSLGIQQIRGIENNCYRMGGDEFVILIEPEMNSIIDDIIASIEELFKKPWHISGTEYYCTMSMGIVKYPNDGTDVNELIKKADIAMYDAKKGGKNRIEYYDAQDDGTSIKRLDIEKNMRLSVTMGCNEFITYLQPIFDPKTEKCIGGEALIRWENSCLGFISPGDFIPLAEHLGLINPIGDYFLKKACLINKYWSDSGIDVHINVNLSIVQLMQNNIVEKIRNIVEETKVNPANLVLEVTESLAINDMSRMKAVLSELKEIGVLIALDDFGTGYSSLNYIKQMSFDIIKVDKSFIDDISTDEYAKTFVKLITELSEKIDVKVCVEGVERKDQLDILKEMNVSMIQGYYYGKPMPFEEFQKKYLDLSPEFEEKDDIIN